MKKFWKEVSVAEVAGGWQVMLDSRAMTTQGKRPQVVPGKPLADLLAAEWAAQGDTLDPATFRNRDMADYALDMIATGEEDIASTLLNFLETDTLCYRADPDEALYRRQQELWEPVLTAFEKREGVKLERASGIIHRPQPTEALATLRARLEALGAIQLAPLFALTSLTASLTIGLSALEEDADPAALWDAANVEEDWQIELWGEDEEATARRKKRGAEFVRAYEFARVART